ncbi:MAG: precorrin-6y C5,15-methyltransferase (decarboxylating) subunit CbiE [Candidatus Bathyarchaeia archaeon]
MVKLNIVGVGPGAADYVTPAAHKTVAKAEIVIGAQRSLDLFSSEIHGEALPLTAKNLNNLLKYAVESAKNGKNVAILSTGDPGFSGLLKSVLNTKLIMASEINVVPGVSAVQACAAKLGLSWDEVALFTFHQGNISADKKAELAASLKAGRTVMLLPDAKAFSPKEIAVYLVKAGFDSKLPVLICENLTLSDEKVTQTSLEDASAAAFGGLCVMVIKANREDA